ncbi:hypothetical protein CAP37_16760 [Hydrogenophaga sp. IBVHS1]|nr:hypothetical protein CAP37_16760 [Hydrogenophaga sp. IBVHS1]
MRIRQATNGHFMIFGRVKMRRLEGKMQHVVELEGLVAHREASMEIRRRFVKEFTELLPRRLMIAEDNDLLSFRFTAEWAEVVAKYILGVAAAMSGDLDVSETLYRDAQERLTQKDKTFGIYRVLSERLPLRIAELYEAKASWAYREWLNTFADELLETFRESLNKFNEMKVPVTLRVRFLLAIKLFVCDRDVRGALTALKPLKNKFDPLWNYNMAFLKGYSGDLKSAARHYRYASKSEIDADILIQIEEFLFWIIEKEPAKEHVHFCLGMFYQLAKGDLVSSVNHFELFLKAKNIASFPAEAALATSWIEEIKKDASWPAIPFSPA